MTKIASAVRAAPVGPAVAAATDDPPFVTSSVNGMVIPLLPHQGGILHRFKRAGNPIVVDRLHGAAPADDRDGRAIIIESENPEARTEAPAETPAQPVAKTSRKPAAPTSAESALPEAPLL